MLYPFLCWGEETKQINVSHDPQREAGMNNGASGWGDHETWTSFSFASSDLDEEDENKEVKEARYVQCLPAFGGGGDTEGFRVQGQPEYI